MPAGVVKPCGGGLQSMSESRHGGGRGGGGPDASREHAPGGPVRSTAERAPRAGPAARGRPRHPGSRARHRRRERRHRGGGDAGLPRAAAADAAEPAAAGRPGAARHRRRPDAGHPGRPGADPGARGRLGGPSAGHRAAGPRGGARTPRPGRPWGGARAQPGVLPGAGRDPHAHRRAAHPDLPGGPALGQRRDRQRGADLRPRDARPLPADRDAVRRVPAGPPRALLRGATAPSW